MSELINLSLTDQILGLSDKSFSSKEMPATSPNLIEEGKCILKDIFPGFGIRFKDGRRIIF